VIPHIHQIEIVASRQEQIACTALINSDSATHTCTNATSPALILMNAIRTNRKNNGLVKPTEHVNIGEVSNSGLSPNLSRCGRLLNRSGVKFGL
jgi:hypothetical protein